MMRQLILLALICGFLAKARGAPLLLDQVIASVTSKYPPYLMALIERDIAAGRLRQAQGAFDLNFRATGSFQPNGYYDNSVGDFVFDQPLPFWGGNVFAGYRISSGSLADYDKNRTQLDGELRAGIRFNLLRDGTIDSRRAALWKARLDQEIADPFIQRQHLDIVRAATRSYFNWVAMGLRLGVTEQLERLAEDRDAAIAELVKKGQLAPIVKTDNERLVVSRSLAVVQARRRFEAASIELSLFYRDERDEPAVISRHDLPASFPRHPQPDEKKVGTDIQNAFTLRPELRRIRLVADKFGIDQRLAKNNLLPHLDLTAGVTENLGKGPYKDRESLESSIGLELRVPLQRNEAKGRLEVITAELQRLDADAKFARERIVAEVRDAWSALRAAHEQIGMTRKNVDLAVQLEDAERRRFDQGATDLLALQIREQATFDARLLQVDAQAEYFRAQADYEAASAIKLNGWLTRAAAPAGSSSKRTE
ncbi:MAG: TolC family protein [Prosthecobacter sp.]|jgi:outer membrane protein TolC|nr:TolC family protein [Prosthecobacter sp.]